MRATCALLALVLGCVAVAWAAPYRTGAVGDPMVSLVQGLSPFSIDEWMCGDTPVEVVGWVRPGDPPDPESALAIGLLVVETGIAAIAMFDQDDLFQIVAVYVGGPQDGRIHSIHPGRPDHSPCADVAEALDNW